MAYILSNISKKHISDFSDIGLLLWGLFSKEKRILSLDSGPGNNDEIEEGGTSKAVDVLADNTVENVDITVEKSDMQKLRTQTMEKVI